MSFSPVGLALNELPYGKASDLGFRVVGDFINP
jgi:hypothetical protein